MVQKRKAGEQADPFASLPPTMPSPTEDYQGWLRYQKLKWKIQKQARVRRRQLFGDRRTDYSDSIGNFFRNQAEMVFINTWQLLQLCETDVPGEVRAFVLINRKIHALKVVVPRTFYLNLKTDDLPDVTIDGCDVEKVIGYALPNGHPSIHLFRLTMPEQTYRVEAKKIRILMNHASVEGVYEHNVPLNVRAVLQLGNVCTFDETQKGVLGRGLELGFDLKTLRPVAADQPYLQDAPISYIYLCHIIMADRQIFALFMTGSSQAYFVVQGRSREDAGLPNMDKIYMEMFQKRTDEAEGMEYQPALKFKTVAVASRKKAYAEVSDAIKKLRAEEKDHAVVMVVQSQVVNILCHDIPIMKDIPV
jgi:DNA polymerase epsilon subunit 1